MPVRGSFQDLKALIGKVARLRREVKKDLKEGLAQEAHAQVMASFRESRGPDGVPWKPITHRDGKPLIDTSRLRNSIKARVTARGFTIATNVVYARIHNEGGWISVPERTTTNVHRADGRFMKRSSARRSKRTSLRVSFSRTYARSWRMTERRFIPDPSRPGLIWTSAMEDVADEILTQAMSR